MRATRRDPATELLFLLAAGLGHGHAGLRWADHATDRLNAGQSAYGDAWARRTLAELLRELTEEAADLGAWAALAAQHPALIALGDVERRRVAEALATAARCGAAAHAALSDALRPVTPASDGNGPARRVTHGRVGRPTATRAK